MEVGDYVAVMDGNRIVTLGWVDMAGRFDETIGCQRFRVNNGEASIYTTGTSLASLAFASEVFGTDLDLDTTQQVAGGTSSIRGWGVEGWLRRLTSWRCARRRTRSKRVPGRLRMTTPKDTPCRVIGIGGRLSPVAMAVPDAMTDPGSRGRIRPLGVVFGDKTPGAVCEDAGDDLEGYVAQAVAEARRIGAVCLPPNVVERLVDEAEY